jgi:type II secretory pathway pseudopilin PulG
MLQDGPEYGQRATLKSGKGMMKSQLQCMGFSRRESLLGLATMALAAAIGLPLLKADLRTEQNARAEIVARQLAQTVLDFRSDTGRWPRDHEGRVDLSLLLEGAERAGGAMLGTLAAHGTPGSRDSRPWLNEIPLDPWQRPYRVILVRGETAAAGTGVIVMSAGPDGQSATSGRQLTNLCRAGRLDEGPVHCCDDIGFLLRKGTAATHP